MNKRDSFTIICDNCGNYNVMETGYRGSIVDDEIDVEVIEDLSEWTPIVEYVEIECFECGNRIEL